MFIAGFTGAGKTTLAHEIAVKYPNTKIVELDWYHMYATEERKRLINEGKFSEDRQMWFDWDKFFKGIATLRSQGKLSLSNGWNQKTGRKDLNVNLDFEGKNGLIVCEGIFLLHPEATASADLVVLKDIDIEESQRRSDERDSHRNDPRYLAFRRALYVRYDKPYFERYKKNAQIIL